MRIVYLLEQPLDDRNYARFGIAQWLGENWEVEVWDLTPLAHPEVWSTAPASPGPLGDFFGNFPIRSASDLTVRLKSAPVVDAFVDFTGDNPWAAFAKFRLIRSGAKRIVGELGSIPDFEDTLSRETRREILGGAGKRMRRAIDKICSLFVRRFLHPSLVIVSGEKSLRSARAAGFGNRVVRAHNFDYDLFLRTRERVNSSGPIAPYAVFLDQNICFHPEFLFDDLDPYVTSDQYFPAVCSGLRGLAKALHLELKIAGHPRAAYDREYFQGIPVVSGRTAEIIRDASVVVCHSSTAIQLAVLFRKPLIFVTTNELKASSLGNYVEKFARILDRHVINLDAPLTDVDWHSEVRIDDAAYEEYRREFVKTDGSPDQPLWKIVAASISSGPEVPR